MRMGLRLGWKYDAGLLFGCRTADSKLRPRFQVIEGVDNAAAELAIDWTGSIGAMLFQRSR